MLKDEMSDDEEEVVVEKKAPKKAVAKKLAEKTVVPKTVVPKTVAPKKAVKKKRKSFTNQNRSPKMKHLYVENQQSSTKLSLIHRVYLFKIWINSSLTC